MSKTIWIDNLSLVDKAAIEIELNIVFIGEAHKTSLIKKALSSRLCDLEDTIDINKIIIRRI